MCSLKVASLCVVRVCVSASVCVLFKGRKFVDAEDTCCDVLHDQRVLAHALCVCMCVRLCVRVSECVCVL